MSAPAQVRRPLAGRHTVVALTGAVALIWALLDQATKLLAERTLRDGLVDLGFMDLRLVYNPNGAFSIPGVPGMFVGVTVVVLALVIRALPKTDRLSLAGTYGLVVGGAVGNCIDRVVRAPGFPNGAVVDFLDLRWWPVFNVADIGIVTGAALLFVLLTKVDREERAAARRRAASPSVRPDAEGLPVVSGADAPDR